MTRKHGMILAALLLLAPNLAAAGIADDIRDALNHGADPNGWVKTDIGRIHPLHMVAWANAPERDQVEALRLLLNAGAKVNGRDEAGNMALHLAVSRLHLAAARFLLQRGADVNARDNAGRTPIFELDSVASHLKNGHLSLEERRRKTRRMVEMARLIVGKGARLNIRDRSFGGETPLTLLAGEAPAAVLSVLLEAGADPNTANKQGGTPLRQAFANPDKEAIKTLVAHGARADAGILIEAMSPGHVAAALALIEAGVDVNGHASNGETPLIAAVSQHKATSRKAYLRIIKSLLDAGARPDLPGKFFGKETTPLKLAEGDGPVMALLRGARGGKAQVAGGARKERMASGDVKLIKDSVMSVFDRQLQRLGEFILHVGKAEKMAFFTSLRSRDEVAQRARAFHQLAAEGEKLLDMAHRNSDAAYQTVLDRGGNRKQAEMAAQLSAKAMREESIRLTFARVKADVEWARNLARAYQLLRDNPDKWRFGRQGEKHVTLTDPGLARELGGSIQRVKAAWRKHLDIVRQMRGKRGSKHQTASVPATRRERARGRDGKQAESKEKKEPMEVGVDAVLDRFGKSLTRLDRMEDAGLEAANMRTLHRTEDIPKRITELEKVVRAADGVMDFFRNRKAYAREATLAAGGGVDEADAAADVAEKMLNAEIVAAVTDRARADKEWASLTIQAYRLLQENPDKWRFGGKGEKHFVMKDPAFKQRLHEISKRMNQAGGRVDAALERARAIVEKAQKKQKKQ